MPDLMQKYLKNNYLVRNIELLHLIFSWNKNKNAIKGSLQ